MAIQRYQAAFRSEPTAFIGGAAAGLNVDDILPTSLGWTSGATLIDNVQLTPPMLQQWSLLAVSISAILCFPFGSAGGNPPYGKLGKILAGCGTPLGQTVGKAGSATLPFQTRLQQLPTDLTGIGVLWDPDTDPLPPTSTALNNGQLGLPVSLSLELPQPISLNQGEALGAGIWMLPSLLGNPTVSTATTGLAIINAGYTITYDDGLNPPPAGYS